MNRPNLHTHTPTLTAIDPRGLAVRGVAYARSEVQQPAQPQVTHQKFDPQGREVERQDPRFFGEGLGPNRSSVPALSGRVLLNISVDAGWTLSLPGPANQVLQRWDSRSTAQHHYDGQLRPVAVTEQLEGDTPRVVERFLYGGPAGSPRNQCGQLIRHDDPATTRHMPDYAVQGLPLLETSHFLESLEPVDWPAAVEARDALLEGGAGLDSRWRYDALGEVIGQTDAMLNRRRFGRTCAGQLREAFLQPAGADEFALVSAIRYSAAGLVEEEQAGNGVITRAEFSPEDLRLQRLSAGRPGQPLRQDLHYAYDPVGNQVQVDDRAKPVTYFKNQRIDPVSTYAYDTRYRLIGATGREVYRAANDPHALVNYREEYAYDAGDNVVLLRHLGEQPFTRRWAVAGDSNRSLIHDDGDLPPDFANEFDGNGNQVHLLRGQRMHWDARNQLSQVAPVLRDDGPDDRELYRYGGGGKRLRKVRCALASGRTVLSEVRYLPGLEIHRAANGEERHVLEAEAGRNAVRLLHWVGTPPNGVDNDHLSYSLTDHLGSSLLELDEQGEVLSEEGYLPFGGRAWWIEHGAKASYKTRGYSGKERDATGLYYYGYRYYVPWQQRWINPDPAGEIDGLNLYCFVGNSPLRYVDRDGRVGSELDRVVDDFFKNLGVPADDPPQVSPPAQDPPERAMDRWLDRFFQTLGSPDPSPSIQERAVPEDLAGVGNPTLTAPTLPVAHTVNDPQPSTSAAAYRGGTEQVNTGRKRFVCPHCNKSMSKMSYLKDHIRNHNGEKPYKCKVCSKGFIYLSHLTVHQSIHKEQKPYSCTVCSFSTRTSSNLKNHMLVHSSVKPHKCDDCSEAFVSRFGLSIHKKIHTNNFPHTCDTCTASFKSKSKLTQHKKSAHGR
ncbi:insecticidal toxin complex protein TccC [Pseudomonas laurylsulfativorans]|uniref:RHS repeat-associated core domain-containing protein n=1 Tax=Pseudomonas laurylsulfativorans TaxID=1943631 RepID=UPI0020A17A0E|nr:RHS repeat-associated core domain-containing protein [Pseudomonas laurylsulfativorans]MCP1419620.1 insecticidal toxin complex protein TccC [Pseudomonas laurylsulfativorans]